FDAMKLVATCRQSGYLAKEGCEVDSTWYSKKLTNVPSCPFHQKVYLDKSQTFQVNKNCYPDENEIASYWFILPPIEEYYFKPKHPNYKPLPPFLPGCEE